MRTCLESVLLPFITTTSADRVDVRPAGTKGDQDADA
jgi:hypothetical protein